MASPSYDCPDCGFSLWTPLGDLDVSALGLYDDARFPGRCLLVLHEHHEDLALVPRALAQAFLDDVRSAGRVIAEATGADRINYAVLGNAQSHVHFHLVPRIRSGDPAPDKAPWESPLPRADLSVSAREEVCAALAAALGDGGTSRP